MTLFLPTILNEFGWDPVEVQLHTIPVWAVAFVVAVMVSWLSDRLQHRSLFILGLSIPPTVGYAILLRQELFSRRAQYVATFLVVLGTHDAHRLRLAPEQPAGPLAPRRWLRPDQ